MQTTIATSKMTIYVGCACSTMVLHALTEYTRSHNVIRYSACVVYVCRALTGVPCIYDVCTTNGLEEENIDRKHTCICIAAEIQAELNSGVIMDFSQEYKRPITAHVQCTLETKTTFWVYTCTMWNIVLQSRRF